MNDKEKLEYVHSCIQEVRNGNIDVAMLDQALAFVEDVREKESAIIIKWYKGSQVGEFVINASSKQLLFEQFYEEYWKPNYGMPNSTMYRFKSKSLDQEYDEWR